MRLFFVGFEVIKTTFKRDFSLNKPRFIVSLYFACFYIKVVLFGLFLQNIVFISIRKSGLQWAYGGLILGTSTGHRRLKHKLFCSSDEKKIMFVKRFFYKFGVINLQEVSSFKKMLKPSRSDVLLFLFFLLSKKIVFVYPLSKSKYKTNFGVFLLSAGWFHFLARFFWKIALSDGFYFTVNALGNLPKK